MRKIFAITLMAMMILALPMALGFEKESGFSRNQNSFSNSEDSIGDRVPDSKDDAVMGTNGPNPKHRFIMWSKGGENLVYGILGNGYFYGEDFYGNDIWGIYGLGVFAGYYDDESFVGDYRHGWLHGKWKAENIFNQDNARGGYIVFKDEVITPN
ncbi:hypothetical protein ACFLZX_05585 [Nanoarchaeota archaeon]